MTGTPVTMTATPDPGTALASTLDHLHLEGAVFLRGEYTERWAYESPEQEAVHAVFQPPPGQRVVLFHLVAEGRCFVRLGPDGEPHWGNPGDVFVLPYSNQHIMGGTEPADPVPVFELLPSPPPWEEMVILKHGEGGNPTSVVCGYFMSDDPLFDPALAALPPIFVVRPPDGPARAWVEASIAFASAHDTSPAATQVPELLLREMLRLHLSTAPADGKGFMGALRDPVLAPAMAELHADPTRKWTVADLATAVSVSRSVLDERFRQVLGRSPIRYLTEWRMHLAEDLLRSTQLPVAEISRRVGYDAEESFSRAFKRARGLAPATWRSTRGS